MEIVQLHSLIKYKITMINEMLSTPNISDEQIKKIKEQINLLHEIMTDVLNNVEAIPIPNESLENKYNKNDLLLMYYIGVLNTSGIDGFCDEVSRLKEYNLNPCDIIDATKKQKNV